MRLDLDVYEPLSLFTEATPDRVWFRVGPRGVMAFTITVRGRRKAVERFVRAHWGDDEWEDCDESVPWLTRPRSRFRLWRQRRRS